jgi:hypothetical protein
VLRVAAAGHAHDAMDKAVEDDGEIDVSISAHVGIHPVAKYRGGEMQGGGFGFN